MQEKKIKLISTFKTIKKGTNFIDENEAYLESPSKLFVEKEARELSSARPLQELNKDLSKRSFHFISSFLELLVPNKMCLVIISLELLKQSHKLILVKILVDFSVEKGLHFIKICSVKPWSQKGLLDSSFVYFLPWLFGSSCLLWCCRHFDGKNSWAQRTCWCPCITELRLGDAAEFGDGFDKSHLCCHFRKQKARLLTKRRTWTGEVSLWWGLNGTKDKMWGRIIGPKLIEYPTKSMSLVGFWHVVDDYRLAWLLHWLW